MTWKKIDWDDPKTWPPFKTMVDVHDPVFGDGVAIFDPWNIPTLPGGGLYLSAMTIQSKEGCQLFRTFDMSERDEKGCRPWPTHFKLREPF